MEERGDRGGSRPLDSRGGPGQTGGGGAGGCESEGLATGRGRHVGVREPPSRSGAGSAGGPTPDPEAEGTGGSGGCSAGTDPCAMEETLGWG